ncbi:MULTISPECIES: carboxymuconolactone decarboxylase family protein [unclassified Caballeronia]|uniref:carboxymuconolactone decarboxylase family protein n=1 Tax=unclassified Caballeronia TaxID=2646786 RepID=UPI00285753B8|nr:MULTISPECIES: carboxymuconolactone decarboxylase family protein [unclassified Caballeronia]MDR5815480.1 carboxymuconolactone decarboxylase family protein [Caballeronia sp. LZ033]MDR5880208.1 carboxymuconolactone decarboxylase family protein [Caballeronia sp. LZ032]
MTQDRLARIDAQQATDHQQRVIAQLGAGRGRIPTPFNIWLHNPRLAEGMEIIGTHVDHSPVLSEAETEVAILATAVFWNAPYVIANHRRHALKAGVPETVVAAILERRKPEADDGRLALVCDAVSALLAGGAVDDARFAQYDAELGRAVIAELLVTIGYFTSISLGMTLHALQPKD